MCPAGRARRVRWPPPRGRPCRRSSGRRVPAGPASRTPGSAGGCRRGRTRRSARHRPPRSWTRRPATTCSRVRSPNLHSPPRAPNAPRGACRRRPRAVNRWYGGCRSRRCGRYHRGRVRGRPRPRRRRRVRPLGPWGAGSPRRPPRRPCRPRLRSRRSSGRAPRGRRRPQYPRRPRLRWVRWRGVPTASERRPCRPPRPGRGNPSPRHRPFRRPCSAGPCPRAAGRPVPCPALRGRGLGRRHRTATEGIPAPLRPLRPLQPRLPLRLLRPRLPLRPLRPRTPLRPLQPRSHLPAVPCPGRERPVAVRSRRPGRPSSVRRAHPILRPHGRRTPPDPGGQPPPRAGRRAALGCLASRPGAAPPPDPSPLPAPGPGPGPGPGTVPRRPARRSSES